MKIQYLALPLLGILPASVWAQTSTLPPASKKASGATTEPAAATLLNRAIATYKNAHGLRFTVASIVSGKQVETVSINYERPDKISVAQISDNSAVRLLLTGSDFYTVEGTSYSKEAAPPIGATGILEATGGTPGALIAAMLNGKNPLTAMQTPYSNPPFQGFKSRTIALGPRVIDGAPLTGLQSTFSFKIAGRDGRPNALSNQLTAWFGGSPLTLRRIQSIYTQNGKRTILTEKVLDQNINPTFTEDTFKFNDTGLKPVAADQPEEQYFDARLKSGAEPFAFTAKSLDGATISPAQYKGKVLILDFWATWCGPCVASLPELKSAYNKYHSQGLEVVGISLDEDKKALTSFISAQKISWPQVFDGKGWNAAVPSAYGVKAIPFMLVIGKDGKISSVNPRGHIDAAVKAALAAH